jgi:DNA-binding transcriptional LysR family regulator
MFASRCCRRYTTERYKVNFDFLPWQADAVDVLEGGKLDLIFHIDEGLLPSHLSLERLYREDWICAVARQSKFGDRLALKQYLAAEHLTVNNSSKRAEHSGQAARCVGCKAPLLCPHAPVAFRERNSCSH